LVSGSQLEPCQNTADGEDAMNSPYEDLEMAFLDELGVDIYSPFGSERHFLTPEAAHEIFVGLALAYLAGFLGLDSLGKATRVKLLAVLQDLRAGVSLSPRTDAAEITRIFDDARRHRDGAETAVRQEQATEQLADALRQFGMDSRVASEHAANLSALIVQELRRGRSPTTGEASR